MLLHVATFIARVESDLNGLIDDLHVATGRYGEAETRAWQRSLPEVSKVLAASQLQDFHVHLGQSGGMALEYRLPASSSWADVVLLGAGSSAPTAVVIELKDWDTSTDRPGPRPGLIDHKGTLHLHPSEQVRSYVEYCRRFHSAVLEHQALVEGCVLFTSQADVAAYTARPHEALTVRFPVFSQSALASPGALPAYLARHLRRPHEAFARAFEDGQYQQDRDFVRQIAQAIRSGAEPPFVLLDEQRKGFELSMDVIERVTHSLEKAVVIVEGPPGSGKSVLAAQLWAAVAADLAVQGSVVFATTSSAQRTNWQKLFDLAAHGRGGGGVVMPANRYNPGLSVHWVKEMRDAGHAIDVDDWQENLGQFGASGTRVKMPDDHLAVSIVDEAHALIDPSAPGARGVPPSGWTMHAGPQAWHIIRASRLSVFLMDSDQSYRDNETTTSDAIERYARDQGITTIERVSLADHQFRCGGSVEYVGWVEHLLGLSDRGVKPSSWRRKPWSHEGAFVFEVVDDPLALDEALTAHLGEGRSARLVASYGRDWITKDATRPHSLPPSAQDFHIAFVRDGEQRSWHRPWNFAPNQDYTLFVQAPEGSVMHENALAEVGCPYVVRGFDYDYLGLLWLDDLVWREGGWRADPTRIFESAWPRTLAAAKREKDPDGPAHQKLVERLARGYRVLLTRAIHGVYVWFEDDETRAHVESLLAGPR